MRESLGRKALFGFSLFRISSQENGEKETEAPFQDHHLGKMPPSIFAGLTSVLPMVMTPSTIVSNLLPRAVNTVNDPDSVFSRVSLRASLA
jgi:hypothetical protein